MAQRLTVLIPTHGRSTLLRRTLASLAACRLPVGYRETVVVENGSPAGASDVVAAASEASPHLRLRYLHVARANKSHALNEALRTIGEGLVVFFDDDVRLEPGVLDAYAAAAERHPQRTFFGGSFGCDYEAAPPSWLLPMLPASARGVNLKEGGTLSEYIGFNWSAYKVDLLGSGWFDPEYGPGSPTGSRGQESEMQRRLRKNGTSMVDVPEAMVWHYVSANRCTPSWAVQRMYYSGVSNGMQARRGAGARLVREGVSTIGAEFPIYVSALAARRHSKKIESKAKMAFWFGYLKGFIVSGRRAKS